MKGIQWMLLAALCLGCVAQTAAQEVVLYVDQQHPAAADSNAGSLTAPFRTINKAAQQAVINKQNGIATRVVVRPGVYREQVLMETFTNINAPNNTIPMVFEAETPGTAVISGSDVWSDWTAQGDGRYTHNWPYDWGVYPNPTNGIREVAFIVRRRETVFVDGVLLRQVMTPAELAEGTYYVDEDADLIHVVPPTGVDMNAALVEVGIREHLWKQEHEYNVTLRGFVFQHAATHWQDAWAAIRIFGSHNITLEDLTVQWNNGIGLFLGETENVTVKRAVMNHNGWDGWGPWRSKNITTEDTETSYNNWRGDWGGFHEWSIGNKIESTHGLTMRRHKAIGNLSRGMWIDLDNTDVVLDEIELSQNLGDGLFLEANQGPITITNSRICENGELGILVANSENITVTQNEIWGNAQGGILISGEPNGRGIINWETADPQTVFTRNWTITNNTLQSEAGDLLGTILDEADWAKFITSLASDTNTWQHANWSDVFGLPNVEKLTLVEWQERTGQDLSSTFEGPDVRNSQPYNLDILHVNQRHPAASDENVGTEDTPLLTVLAAVRRAFENKLNFKSSHVVVHPGMYRERVELETYTSFNDPLNDTPMLFEAAQPGTAVISGSDVWDNWRAEGGRFVHDWTANWGIYNNPTGGAVVVDEVVRRREMVFVEGELLKQVLSLDALVEGTFFVDEQADKIYALPRAGVDMTQALVEVGNRELLWSMIGEDHVTIRGFTFQHAATHWEDRHAAVRIMNATDVLLEDVQIIWNNGLGLYLIEDNGIELRQVTMNHNGWDGWHIIHNRTLKAEGTETSYNNWRGDWGGLYDNVTGNKLEGLHGLVLQDHKAVGNASTGLWLQGDNQNVELDNLVLDANRLDGLRLELNPGPVQISGSRISENGGYGLQAAHTEYVTLENNSFQNSIMGEIMISGSDETPRVENWETGDGANLGVRNWIITNNEIQGTEDFLIGTALSEIGWDRFVNTLQSDFNNWMHDNASDVFQLPGDETVTLKEWQKRTGQDMSSTFNGTGVPNDQSVQLTTAYPNPTRTKATFSFQTDFAGTIRVTVYDVLGRRLTELFVGEVEARKEYTFEVDVRDWASGLHMYQVAGNGFQKSGSFTVIK